MKFSGSYRQNDVEFLLKQLDLVNFTSVSEKELLIQSGKKHYSSMLSPESLPSSTYMQVFEKAYEANKVKMAADCMRLAQLILKEKGSDISIVSLARAGTPVGVILKHLIEKKLNKKIQHYSISIIRDRGVDEVALRHILKNHADTSLVFVDGWTGKGVISRELKNTITRFNKENNTKIDSGLYVLSDLAGTAACSASYDDYLIPSSILNATVSGLISRSILNEDILENDFHGCVYYEEFLPEDKSLQFVDGILEECSQLESSYQFNEKNHLSNIEAANISKQCINNMMNRYQVADINLIKPGIGEATRVLLRRVPKLIIIKNVESADVRHLIVLAKEKNVSIEVDSNLPYQAVSIIRSTLDG